MEILEGRLLLAGGVAEYPLSASASGGTINFVAFTVPGSTDTVVSAINDAGTVAGTSGGGVGFVRDADGNLAGFLVPGLASTIVTGIDNAGTVVGYNTFGYGPGFLRDAAGNVTTFQIPGLTPGNLIGVFSPVINDAGLVAGNYSSESDGPPHGFVRDAAGNITTFGAPGSSSTTVTAINDAETVLGSSNSPSFPNYLRDAAGHFTTFSVPGGDSTFLNAINNSGTVAGNFQAGGLPHGFLRDAAGNLTTFDISGAKTIGVTAINDLGMVAGVFTTGRVQQEGFLRDAAGNITTFDPLPGDSGVAGVFLNNAGELAGSVFDGGGRVGFVGTPGAPAVPTNTRLTALSNPSFDGEPLNFTAVVTPGQSGVAPAGVVAFSFDGGAATVVPLALVGGQTQASLTIATLSPGNHTVVASFGGSPGLAPSSATVSVSVIAPPTVVSVQRLGFHADPTRVVLGFSTALDPTRAQDVRNYRFVGPGGRVIAVDKAVYSPLSNTVVLSPHGRLDLHLIYQLRVNGSAPGGIANPFGVLLDGAGNGLPGSNFVTNLTAADLVLGGEVPGGPAGLAQLRQLLSAIEADQARELARPHASSSSLKAKQARPAAVSSPSPKPVRPTARHDASPPAKASHQDRHG